MARSTGPRTPAACSTGSGLGCAAATCTCRAASVGVIPEPSCSRPRPGNSSGDQACENLALDADPADVVAHLAQALDEAWRRAADGMAENPDFRIEHRD